MAKLTRTAGESLTMADLAELAGVSKITVSRALRDSPQVRAPVRARIKDLAAAHGYRLNVAARNLRTRRSHSITAVIEMNPTTERPMSEPLLLPVIGGLLQAVTMRRYRLVLTTRAEALSSNVMDTEGVILLGEGQNGAAALEMQRFALPLVIWGPQRPPSSGVACLGSDNVEGGRLVGEHLSALGRKKILFLGDPTHAENADRLAGVRAAVSGRGVGTRALPCPFGREAANLAIRRQLGLKWTYDAVVCCSDAMALGAIDALEHAGLRVPQDVAVTGFDDAMREPRLTSVRQDWDQVGQRLAGMMFDLLDEKEVASVVLPVELVVRASTAG